MNIEELAKESLTADTGIDWLDDMRKADETRPYYVFLYKLAQTMKAKTIVELGVQTGRSTAHFACGAPNARVIGIDIELWDMDEILQRCPNIKLIKKPSQDVDLKTQPGPIDILFIDSDHSYEQVKKEWELYRPLMRPGGVILVDDIYWSDGLTKAWNEMTGEKHDISFLHDIAGFGAIVV